MSQVESWIARYEACQWNTFGRRRLVLSHGKGSWVWDINGKAYLDFLTGIAVNNLGHCHPAIVEAVQKQAETLMHCTNLYYIPVQIEWAEMLTANSFADQVFFANSGAEANEGLIKLARKYASTHFEEGRRNIVCCLNSFHGRTMNTLSATGQDKVKIGFDPLMPGYRFVPFNDPESLREAVDDSVCAILTEPIQGEGGVIPATDLFMKTLEDLRREKGILLLLDEVQTGLGRTGKNFAYEHYNMIPDALSLAKPLSGGVGSGAVLARKEVADVMTPGSHGSTMGGNPLAAAGGLAYARILFGDRLSEQVSRRGEVLFGQLKNWIDDVPCVTEVRGKGFMVGIQLDRPGAEVVRRCEERGLLINCTAGSVIRLLPPLNIAEEDLEKGLTILKEELEAESQA